MKEIKKGYHITQKSNLPNIQKNGLQPKIGRRSNSVNEYTKILSFTPWLHSIPVWKKRLYENIPFDDLVILAFDLDGIEFIERYDSAGDYFTKSTIPPKNLNLIEIIKKDETYDNISYENLENIFSTDNNSNYEISEKPIIELFLEAPIIDSVKKIEITELLAQYEHQKWSEEYSKVEWKAQNNEDGSLIISEQDIEQIQKYCSITYEQSEEVYKQEIQDAVMESFFIMQENHMIEYLGISDEELLSILEHTEYARRNRWSQYMLSVCLVNNGKYIIPLEKAKLWKSEMRTNYNELNENQKDSDRKEVTNIFEKIKYYISEKQISMPSQPAETEFY